MAVESEYVELSTGARMPILGLGTWQTKDSEAVEIAIDTALDVGYRHIDTAFVYKNEAAIGRALQKALEQGKVKRQDLFIVTKLPNNGHNKTKVKHFLQKSLENLQLTYVDLYLIHTPYRMKGKHDEDFLPMENGKLIIDDETDHLQTWKAMEDIVEEGLAKSIGLSNFNSRQIKYIYENARIKPANLQVECHAYLSQNELLDFCKKHGITFTAYSPLGSPSLRKFAKENYNVDSEVQPLPMNDPALKPLCEKYDKTPAQILLRWLVQREILVIPKSSNPERIRENAQIFDFKLSKEDMDLVGSLNKNLRYFTGTFPPCLKDHPDFPFGDPW